MPVVGQHGRTEKVGAPAQRLSLTMGSQLVQSSCLRGGCSGEAGVYVIQYGVILAAISPGLHERRG